MRFGAPVPPSGQDLDGAGHAVRGGFRKLRDVRLALQLPQGWKAVPAGPTVFNHVGPGVALVATFRVTPPAYAPNASAVVHATATMGDLQREAGVSVTVTG